MTREATHPPVAPQREHTHTEHGVSRSDPWYWLRDRGEEEVLDYIKAENAWTAARTAHLAPLRQSLFEEMKGRLKEDDLSAPVHDGPWVYYTRTEAGKSYPIHCRRDAQHPDAPEQVILDVNALAEGHPFFSVGPTDVSPDHRLLAFATDTSGDELYTLYIKDLSTGELLPDTIEDVADSATWAADGAHLFYTTRDEAHRPWQVKRHRLGQEAAGDVLVYQEDDDRFSVDIHRSRSDALLILDVQSMITTEVRILDASEPTGEPHLLQARHQGMEYMVEHQGDRLLIITNDHDGQGGEHDEGALNFKLMEAPLGSTSRAEWRELIPHREDVLLEGVDAFRDFLVLTEREGGHPQLTVWDLESGERHRIHMPEPSYSLWLEDNPTYDTHHLRLGYTSLVTPESVYDYDMRSRDLHLVKAQPVLGGFDPGHYEARYTFATAPDGTKVPISFVFKRGMEPDGTHPALLYGYGSYGMVYDPEFSSTRLSLVDRGVIFAIAHIRGGGEMGRSWYEGGKLLHKKNTFTDFIACAEALIEQGWTSPDKLVIRGGSAGGLLIGATVNMRPELFKAAVAAVPFVDVVTTMLDESIPLTAGEWEEWGDPREKAYFDYMLSYSPYDNVEAKRYPNLLIISGLNDSRVQYWEPTKWTAKLRATITGGEVLLKTNMDAGHRGASGRYDALKEEAFAQAFILEQLGLGAARHPGP